jgi:MFS family permease
VGKWTTILILAAAQFVMVLDSTVMNVSISQIVVDLDTTIQGVQTAITMYTLVMAAFMFVGAKLGDIWGRDRAFAVGLAIYGTGSFITAVSPNLQVLLVGWSLIEGLGAVLVIPAIAALIANSYEGRDRALAYGIIGGIAAAAVAAGPLIGGWVTTTFTWRVVFAAETVVVIAILVARRAMKPSPRVERAPTLDLVGAALSATGFGVTVFAILQSSSWGWIRPKGALTLGGVEITPFGFSAVPFLVLIGLGVLWTFAEWEDLQRRRGRDTLVDLTMLRITTLRAGLSTIVMMQVALLGTFFVLPVYLQVVLGFNAFETGQRLLPMSAAMLVAAVTGPRLAARRSPRRVAQLGLLALAFGTLILLATIDVQLRELGFGMGMFAFGIGAGLLASQVGNIVMSSVGPHQTNEAGGLQGTAQNFGASLGTALIGAVLLTNLAAGFTERVAANPASLPGGPGGGDRGGRERRAPGAPGRRRGAAAPRRRRAEERGRGGRERLRCCAAGGAEDRAGRRRRPLDPRAVDHPQPAGIGGDGRCAGCRCARSRGIRLGILPRGRLAPGLARERRGDFGGPRPDRREVAVVPHRVRGEHLRVHTRSVRQQSPGERPVVAGADRVGRLGDIGGDRQVPGGRGRVEGAAAEQPHRAGLERREVPADKDVGLTLPVGGVERAPQDDGVVRGDPRNRTGGEHVHVVTTVAERLADDLGDLRGGPMLGRVGDEDSHRCNPRTS